MRASMVGTCRGQRALVSSHGARPIASRCANRHRLVVNASTAKVPPKELLEVATNAAKAAAQVVMDALDKPKSISFKTGLQDVVTETDKAAEAACISAIQAAFPDHAILGEEGGAIGGGDDSDYLWCLDPIDGTSNFSRDFPGFAVSVGVLRRAVPVAGAIILFTGGPGGWGTRTFTAYRNGGSFCDGKPLMVSRVKKIEEAIAASEFSWKQKEMFQGNMEIMEYFVKKARGFRRTGAVATDLCYIANGTLDVYWGYSVKPWDVAAGVLILEEAGGRVSTLDGLAYSVFDRHMLATNDALFEKVLQQVEPVTRRLQQNGADFSPWYIPKTYHLHTGAQLE